jgi:hypothetical protein
MIEELYGEVEENQTIEVRSILCYQAWLTVLADTYLFLLRVIPGDTRQFKATLLILQGSSISFNTSHNPIPNVTTKETPSRSLP